MGTAWPIYMSLSILDLAKAFFFLVLFEHVEDKVATFSFDSYH